MHPRLTPLRLLLILTALPLWACDSEQAAGENELAKLPPETNVLLVTMDTTRADRIGSYGHSAAQTPVLDGLAREGVRFSRAYGHVPLTLPTHASILTGTLPPEHGIHDNGRRALSNELTTLATVFKQRGYRTGAFVSAIALDRSFGLDQGFDVYDDELNSGTVKAGRIIHRAGDQTTDRALQWLQQGEQPFFLWVHYYDPHAEYSPPVEFAGLDAYDGEIAFMDREVGRLLDWLETNRLRANSLVVAIADHGESLGEKGEHTHASLIYDGTQRIPFLLSSPGCLPAGLELQQPVGQSDLFPTLMELFDWATPVQVSGTSLVPLIRGESAESRDIWLESEYAALNFGWSPLHGIVHERWKYIAAPTPELYDLLADPGELNNLAASDPALVERLQARMQRLLDSLGTFGSDLAQTGPDLAKGLSSLGYVQGLGNSGPDSNSSTINPIEHIDTLEQYHAAIGFGNVGEYKRMLVPLEKVAAAFPDAAGFRTQLGDVYRRLGRLEEARRELDAALELNVAYDPAHFYLAELERGLGNYPEAIRGYRANLVLRPDYLPARERLGALLALTDETIEALAIFQALVTLESKQPRHWLSLADVQRMLGKTVEQVRSLEQALSLDPGDLGTQNLLAWVLATSRDNGVRNGARARLLAEGCVEASGRGHPEPLLTLAAALAETGDFAAARSIIREAIELAKTSRPPETVTDLQTHEQVLLAGKPLRE
ncbi:MAG: choline-sulfatase [Candidatus Paceibacteria bacterium]|jgi:choline-sulfatase